MMGIGFGNMFGGMWLLMMLGMAAVYIIFLVAAWRAMRAHEAMANTLRDIAENLRTKS